jgi:hypothetical protein
LEDLQDVRLEEEVEQELQLQIKMEEQDLEIVFQDHQ